MTSEKLEGMRELTEKEHNQLKGLEKSFKDYSAVQSLKEKQNIKKIRKVIENYKAEASMFLGGVPMITSDMTDFIADDVKKFGVGVFIFLLFWFYLKYLKV